LSRFAAPNALNMSHPPSTLGGISRALYVAAYGQRVVIVRVFVKETQKAPRREIDLALNRAKEVLP